MHASAPTGASADPLPNRLGALATAAADAQDAAMACDRRTADVAAILSLREFAGVPIGELAGVLGLSHSATVRVADRLCAERIAVRRSASAADARQVGLVLTAAGEREAERLQERRLRALDDLLSPLSAGDRSQLAELLDRLLRARRRSDVQARHTCRFCDHPHCHGAACPAGSSRAPTPGSGPGPGVRHEESR